MYQAHYYVHVCARCGLQAQYTPVLCLVEDQRLPARQIHNGKYLPVFDLVKYQLKHHWNSVLPELNTRCTSVTGESGLGFYGYIYVSRA